MGQLANYRVFQTADIDEGQQFASQAWEHNRTTVTSGEYGLRWNYLSLAQTDFSYVEQDAPASNGGLLDVKAGPKVKNLAQVKPGDRVVLRYREALAAQIVPSSSATPPVQTSTHHTTAPLGQKPAGLATAMTRARVTIVSVDADHNRVSFVGPARIERTAYVESPEMRRLLHTLKPGDQVELTYTMAVAISVELAGGWAMAESG